MYREQSWVHCPKVDRPIFVSADVFHLLHSPIYSFFSIEFHRVHAFDTFFVGWNAPAYHLIKPFQSSRLSMKNKPRFFKKLPLMRIFCLNWCSAGILCNVLLPFLEFIAIVLSFFLLLSYLIELPNSSSLLSNVWLSSTRENVARLTKNPKMYVSALLQTSIWLIDHHGVLNNLLEKYPWCKNLYNLFKPFKNCQ